MTRTDDAPAAPPCFFGADVGGTKTHSIVTDAAGTLLAELREPTPPGDGPQALDLVANHFRRLGAGRRLLAAGIGVPGAVHPRSGHLDRAPNLPGLAGRDLTSELATRLGVPVAVENDVNMAALGEAWLGHGRGLPAEAGGLALIALGTGVGLGLVFGETILRGARGVAGEIAFLPVGGDPYGPAARECGALESVSSGAALVEDYRRRGGTRPGSLRELAAADVDDPALETVLEGFAGRIALAVLAVESVIDPALYVFGGGIGARPDILSRITAALDRLGGGPRDCRTSLLGNRAGAFGAARAAIRAAGQQPAAGGERCSAAATAAISGGSHQGTVRG